ncbi:MAG TPA: helix-turn-helix transcriptional regulator, partial [Candidatus Methylacidiphilales bacterium]
GTGVERTGAERIHRLWDELSAFSSNQTEEALLFLFEQVSGWIGADDAQWYGCIRPAHLRIGEDFLLGWRIVAHRSLHAVTPAQLAVVAEVRRQLKEGAVDAGMTTHKLVAQSGTFRVRRLRDGVRNDFIDFTAFRRTAHYRVFYESLGIVDRMWVAFPLNDDAESYLVFDRTRKGARFSKADAALAAAALRGLRWFHLRLFLSRGLLVGDKPLTPMQRRVVQGLLGGKDEKAIAADLGQSPATTHKHVETVYRALGVNSRPALMALWLAGR